MSRSSSPHIEPDLVAAGMFAGHPVTSVARTFLTRAGVDGWARLSLAEQCALPLKDRRVVGWLIVTGRLVPSPDYLVACRPYLGEVAAHHHRSFHERFSATSTELGFDRIVTRLQWSGAGQGDGAGRPDPRASDEGRDRPGARGAGGRHRPSPTRQPRFQGAERGAVRRADHLVPPGRARRPAPQAQPRRLGGAGRPVGDHPSPSGVDVDGLHRADAPVLAALDDGACRGRAAGVRLLARRQRP